MNSSCPWLYWDTWITSDHCQSQEAQSPTVPSNISSHLNELQLDQIKVSTFATVQGNKGILYLIVQAH